MKGILIVVAICLASAAANVVPVKGERKVADATFMQRQKIILDLFVGLGHDEYVKNEFKDFDFFTHADYFTKASVLEEFVQFFKSGFLPKNGIFTLECHHVRGQAIKLFDLFFFAKDFDTFYKVAGWAKEHINPVMYSYALTLALFHREDTRGFSIPPPYEIFPNYFVPQAVLHEIYDYKMSGVKQGRFEYNNTGYEYNYHISRFGGPFGQDVKHSHNEYKVSYFREDVGLNTLYAYFFRYPAWMDLEKYNLKTDVRRGELFYIFHQQLLARYTLERISNALPYTEVFAFDKPLEVGYNPKISHFNGEAFLARPDGYTFESNVYKFPAHKAETFEDRLLDAIDFGSVWNLTSSGLVSLFNEEGFDLLGHLVQGSAGYDDVNGKYYGSYYHTLMDALSAAPISKDNVNYNGGVTSMKLTTLRDPAFYQMLVRIVSVFQKLKFHLPSYTKHDLLFPGVTVTDFEVDKLVTFFDMFDFEVTNGVAVQNEKEYIDYKYQASQYRLNHKPFNYKVAVNSDAAYDGMVRVFIGPKFDSEEHVLNLSQKRMAMVEIDRFPVKVAAGKNVFERNSKESPLFVPDSEGFRDIYERLEHSMKTNEPYYIKDKVNCGIPERLQLPRGWKSGLPYSFVVVVTPFEHKESYGALCGSAKLNDNKPFGFPFDRPIHGHEFHVPNIFFKDELIYHKEDVEVNRAQ